MTFSEQTGHSIDQAFEEFHENNPEVFTLFKQQAQRAIDAGVKRISAKAIINWIRWECSIKTRSYEIFNIEGEERRFKINDAFHSRYSRLFVNTFPEHINLFEFRELRQTKKLAA